MIPHPARRRNSPRVRGSDDFGRVEFRPGLELPGLRGSGPGLDRWSGAGDGTSLVHTGMAERPGYGLAAYSRRPASRLSIVPKVRAMLAPSRSAIVSKGARRTVKSTISSAPITSRAT